MPFFIIIVQILLIALSLSADAFAVSVTNGMTANGSTKRTAVLQGLYFGGFQFIMPLIGHLIGSGLSSVFESYDHWIAVFLLAVIGGKMIFDSLTSDGENPVRNALTHKKLIFQAFATSVDALAVGISISVMRINIWAACSVIGAVTFAVAFLGALLGKKAGKMLGKRAEIAGGVILILIGVKILIEHLAGG